MPQEALLELTTDIVTAHVGNNAVLTEQLPQLIASVYASLAGLGMTPEVVEEQISPAVSIRSSIKPDAITCLECGTKLKSLKRHLLTTHGLTPDDYRARWNLKPDYPMVCSDYAAKRQALAVEIGLGKRGGRKPKAVPQAEVAAEKPKTRARRKLGIAAN